MDYLKQLWASSQAVRILTVGCGVALAVAMATADPGEFPTSETAATQQAAKPGFLDRAKSWWPWSAKATATESIEKVSDRAMGTFDRGADLAEKMFDRVEGTLDRKTKNSHERGPSQKR